MSKEKLIKINENEIDSVRKKWAMDIKRPQQTICGGYERFVNESIMRSFCESLLRKNDIDYSKFSFKEDEIRINRDDIHER